MIKISDVEASRERAGLTQAEMARMFKVPTRNYNNWIYRSSLPKEQLERAKWIIEILSSSSAPETDKAIKVLELHETLNRLIEGGLSDEVGSQLKILEKLMHKEES